MRSSTVAPRRLAAIADILEARVAVCDTADREQAHLAVWADVTAEVGAALDVPSEVAAHLMTVAEVFAGGTVPYRLVNAVVFRTELADFVRCRDLTCRFPGCDQTGSSGAVSTTRSRGPPAPPRPPT
ncbi:hypothetical protein [Mycolicibacterium litorale]|uniref:hypothetical protein n=1 Tax=Mycolicibacterium litorale TaxID=758802 RepID=UPI0039A15149